MGEKKNLGQAKREIDGDGFVQSTKCNAFINRRKKKILTRNKKGS